MNENTKRNRTNDQQCKKHYIGVEIRSFVKFVLSLYGIDFNSHTSIYPKKSTIETWAHLGIVKIEGCEMQFLSKNILLYGKSHEFKEVPYGITRLIGDTIEFRNDLLSSLFGEAQMHERAGGDR